jgi:hypothetical protein
MSVSMLSYLGDSVGPREKDLPSTPTRATPPLSSDDEDKKALSPTHIRLDGLGVT